MKELFKYIKSDYQRYTGKIGGVEKYYGICFSEEITALNLVFG